MEKLKARELIKDKLSKLSLTSKQIFDDKICNYVIDSRLVFGNIFVYKALNSEVNTDKIIDYYINIYNVYVPVIKDNEMFLVRISKDSKYKIGSYGIREPIGELLNKNDVNIDVTITPLLGYDDNLNRLGKGKGYYDKYFEKNNCIKIGLAYTIQNIKQIDCENHDVKMDYIVNENGVIKR